MDNNRGQSIFLSVVGIATLLVAIIGATFAYFSISVTGNETASSIQVVTAKLGGVVFDASGDEINATNVYPGWSATKHFTVATTTGDQAPDTNSRIQYQIFLDASEFGLATADTNSDFVYQLDGTATNAQGTVVDTLTDTKIPAAASSNLGSGTLAGQDSHSYTMTVKLIESSSNQNDLQGLAYRGVLRIVVATEQGLRTYANNASGWTQYPAN